MKLLRIDYEQKTNGKNLWEYFATFKPPQNIGFGKGKIFETQVLDSNDLEYRYVAYKFLKTLNGRVDETLNIKSTLKMMLSEGLP